MPSKGIEQLLETHADVVDTIKELEKPNSSRQDLKNQLRKRLPSSKQAISEELICEVIDLAVRLWLMIDMGELLRGFVPGQNPLVWEQGFLKDLLHERFNSHKVPQRVVRVKLERLFTARNLERIADLQIIWIRNISDHLKLMYDDSRIAIFHHAAFLKYHQNRKCQVFSAGFIEETIRTLALLFPQYDKKFCRWFKVQQSKFDLDHMVSASGHLTTEQRQIENFVFWHDRLGILKQVFDEAEPSTIAQWWFDRRRRVQWYTFWVAALVLALTVFFGAIQCVEGGLQVYKAYYPS